MILINTNLPPKIGTVFSSWVTSFHSCPGWFARFHLTFTLLPVSNRDSLLAKYRSYSLTSQPTFASLYLIDCKDVALCKVYIESRKSPNNCEINFKCMSWFSSAWHRISVSSAYVKCEIDETYKLPLTALKHINHFPYVTYFSTSPGLSGRR